MRRLSFVRGSSVGGVRRRARIYVGAATREGRHCTWLGFSAPRQSTTSEDKHGNLRIVTIRPDLVPATVRAPMRGPGSGRAGVDAPPRE